MGEYIRIFACGIRNMSEQDLLSLIAQREASPDLHLQFSAQLKEDALSTLDSSHEKVVIESEPSNVTGNENDNSSNAHQPDRKPEQSVNVENTGASKNPGDTVSKPKKKRRRRKRRLAVNWVDFVLDNKRKIKRAK